MRSSNTRPGNLKIDLAKEIKALEENDLESEGSDVRSLQDQINSLEDRINMKESFSSFKLKASHIDQFIKNIDQSEREIKKLEKSINCSPKIKNNSMNSRLLDDLKAKLISERQKNFLLKKENEKLTKKIFYKADVGQDIVSLQDDYKTLIDSFKRSENIRKKQKKLIQSLKTELITKEKNSSNKLKNKNNYS
jgi:hypothetical protein